MGGRIVDINGVNNFQYLGVSRNIETKKEQNGENAAIQALPDEKNCHHTKALKLRHPEGKSPKDLMTSAQPLRFFANAQKLSVKRKN